MADVANLKRKVERYGDQVSERAAKSELGRTLDERAPTDTRHLRDGQTFVHLGPGRWRIWYPAGYASFTDRGNAAGGTQMVPTRAKVLAFPIRGVMVFTMRVTLSAPGWWSDAVTKAGWLGALRAAVRKM